MAEPIPSAKKRSLPSPGYPSRSLEGCYSDVRRIFQAYTGGTFSDVNVASTLGVRVSTGAFRIRIASLKHYGLIEGSGGAFRVSPLFRRLDRAEPDSSNFRRAAYESVLRVPAFSRILTSLRNHLPTRELLVRRLMHDFGFSAAGATRAAAVLRESLAYARVLDASGNVVPPRAASVDDENEPNLIDPPPEGISTPHEWESSTPDAGRAAGLDQRASSAPPQGQLQLQFPIVGSPGRHFTLLLPHDLQPHEAGYIQGILDATLSALAKGV